MQPRSDHDAGERADGRSGIAVRDCSKTFVGRDGNPVQALDHISFDVRDREFVSILGPSGCGKTTLLRIIGGLIELDEGDVTIDGKSVDGPGPDRAIVFQSFALLPWLDIQSNVAFGLQLRGANRKERLETAREFVKMVGLEGFEKRLPKELSGGMQQRVGLARALAVDPRILLLDEPFGALDEQTRRILQEQLLEIWERERKTAVFITHSIDEALFLSDRIIVMSPRPGRVHRIVVNPLSRPGTREIERSSEFADLKAELWDELRGMHDEVAS